MSHTAIVIFRNDLRLADNHALIQATKTAKEVICVYIFDTKDPEIKNIGEGSSFFLSSALHSLSSSLGGKLNVEKGSAETVIASYVKKHKATMVHWNTGYDPYFQRAFSKIAKSLEKKGVEVFQHSGNVIWDPATVLKSDGTPYKVFSAYYKRGCRAKEMVKINRSTVNKAKIKGKGSSTSIDKLFPKGVWDLDKFWNVSEKGAINAFASFRRKHLSKYKSQRDVPSLDATSRLSPFIHFGLISSRSIYDQVYKSYVKNRSAQLECFLSELGWREFSIYLLYHFPKMATQNLNEKFNKFKWDTSASKLKAWENGRTGYPIIDAAMHQLTETGYMHNRMRMVVASFLTKNLLINWTKGAKIFTKYLCDADIASNSSGWQWVAGCGVDSAPYFRIFNPIIQAKKFDPKGEYIKQYVPELKDLPTKYLYAPWECPESVWQEMGIKYGKDYPKPIVDQKESARRALATFKRI